MFAAIHTDLEGVAAERFRALTIQLKRLQEMQAEPRRLDALCQDELSWIESAPRMNDCHDRYIACIRLLTDLAKLRWRIVQNGFGIELSAPTSRQIGSDEIGAYKTTVRQELLSQVHIQFQAQSVRDFIKKMEHPAASTKLKPVTDLIADGRELWSRLLDALEATGEKRLELSQEAIQPYLQLIEPDAKDPFTGHFLSDIWRYFRYTWAIPATNVPGRNLFYLIRDAGHPSHAIIGITGLSNAPLALRERDNQIGWTADATQKQAAAAADLTDGEARLTLTHMIDALERNIMEGLAAISHDNLLTSSEAATPSEEIIQRLRRRAAEFSERREVILSDGPLMVNELEDVQYGDPEVSDKVLALESKVFGKGNMDDARRVLTAKKRAAELARLLKARMVLREYRPRLLSPTDAPSCYAMDIIATAVNTAWISAKNARAGTSMLEMTVCGAVRPYNSLLGGKLAALLMLSPEVADDYTRRYGKSASVISSMMKNELVIKDTRLVFLGTTSLYLHGSSQYNRLRLPEGIISPEQQEIRYQRMGETGGFGTVQFSAETVEAIERVVRAEKGFRQVNSVFGEGRSPKLRKLREGLDMLGFPPDILMQHHQPRIIYGALLYPDAIGYLQSGQGEMPDYIVQPHEFRDASKRIADYWVKRWLIKRLDHEPTIKKLSSTMIWMLSESIPVEEPQNQEPSSPEASEMESRHSMQARDDSNMHLWKSLAAAGHDSCSDCLSETDIERLHVPSALEEYLLSKAKESFSILVTGNAGDGKTHLLRRIASMLEETNALVDLDATAVMRKGSVAPVLDRWRSAIDAGRPYCLAANEYPMHELIRTGKAHLPDALHAELVRQTRNRLAYETQPTPEEAAFEKLLVVDLSLRNPLSPSFAIAALRQMLNDPAIVAYAASNADPDFTWNHQKLSAPRIQERIGKLFQRLVNLGHRSTIRELWILLARALIGDPTEAAPAPPGSPSNWYSTRLWSEGSGSRPSRLATLLSRHADPVACSHPQWDRKLEHAADMDASQWLDQIPPMDLSHSDAKVALPRFAALKRRFYFEHAKGEEAFALAASHGKEFADLLAGAVTADDVFKGGVLRAINYAYCPKPFSGNDRDLHLWLSHRYHEQPTRAYLANRSIPAANFTVQLPRLPLRLSGAFEYRPDHLALRYPADKPTQSLRIDAALYSTLALLAAGFPRHLAPESELNKLDDFISRLHLNDIPQSRQFLIYSAEARLATRVTLDENAKRYLEVQKL